MLGKRATTRHEEKPSIAVQPAPVIEPVRTKTLVVAALIVAVIIGLFFVLLQVASIAMLFLLAIVFAEGIRGPARWFEQWHLGRAGSILAVYVLMILILAALIAVLVAPIVHEVNTLVAHLPVYEQKVSQAVTTVQQKLNIAPNQNLTSQVVGSLNTAKDVIVAIGGYTAGLLVNFVLVLILSFLWLMSSDRLKAFVVDLSPPRQQPLASDVIREMGFRMGGYVSATGVNMVIVGLATGLTCWILGLPSPVLLGIFAGLAAAVPLIGPVVGMIPAILLAFTVSPAFPLVVVAALAVVQLLDANIIVPPLMNRVVALPALSVVLALLIGGTLAGIIGALLAIPLAAAVHVFVNRVLVPMIHYQQGRTDEAFARAATPMSPGLQDDAPAKGRRRSAKK